MLTMVMEKPIQLTIVSDVPRVSSGAFCATSVEKSGESAVTVIPHINKNKNNNHAGAYNKISGDKRQHTPDKNKARPAIFFVLNFCDNNPPVAQPIPPIPITRNAMKEIFNCVVDDNADK
jgi:hypothetical protein